jgi:hypothetical protein
LERFYRGCAARSAAQPQYGFNKKGKFIIRDNLMSETLFLPLSYAHSLNVYRKIIQTQKAEAAQRTASAF